MRYHIEVVDRYSLSVGIGQRSVKPMRILRVMGDGGALMGFSTACQPNRGTQAA